MRKILSLYLTGWLLLGLSSINLAQTPISCTLLLAAGDTTDGNSFTTATMTPTADRGLYGFIVGHDSSAPADLPVISSDTGLNVTWTSILDYSFDSNTKRLNVVRALHASPGSGTVSIDTTNNLGGVTWHFSECSGIKTSGTNGADSIQSGSIVNNTGTGTTTSLTLNAFANSFNRPLVFAYTGADNAVLTPESGWTELTDIGHSAPNVRGQSAWRNDSTDTTYGITVTSGVWGSAGFELVDTLSGSGGFSLPKQMMLTGVGEK